jgi:hypothetical protein
VSPFSADGRHTCSRSVCVYEPFGSGPLAPPPNGRSTQPPGMKRPMDPGAHRPQRAPSSASNSKKQSDPQPLNSAEHTAHSTHLKDAACQSKSRGRRKKGGARKLPYARPTLGFQMSCKALVGEPFSESFSLGLGTDLNRGKPNRRSVEDTASPQAVSKCSRSPSNNFSVLDPSRGVLQKRSTRSHARFVQRLRTGSVSSEGAPQGVTPLLNSIRSSVHR